MKIATVVFAYSMVDLKPQQSNTYDYVLPEGSDAQPGDLGVVDSPYSGVAPVLIVGIKDEDRPVRATKRLLDTISLAKLRDARAQAERQRAVRKVLDEKLKKRMEDDRYAALLGDPEAVELMKEIGLA